MSKLELCWLTIVNRNGLPVKFASVNAGKDEIGVNFLRSIAPVSIERGEYVIKRGNRILEKGANWKF